MKKETIVIAACVVLFVVLLALVYIESQNPEGGVALVSGIFHKLFGN